MMLVVPGPHQYVYYMMLSSKESTHPNGRDYHGTVNTYTCNLYAHKHMPVSTNTNTLSAVGREGGTGSIVCIFTGGKKKKGGREGEKEGRREGGKEGRGRKEGGKEGGKKGGKEGGKEGRREGE